MPYHGELEPGPTPIIGGVLQKPLITSVMTSSFQSVGQPIESFHEWQPLARVWGRRSNIDASIMMYIFLRQIMRGNLGNVLH